MKKVDFLSELQDILELDELNETSSLTFSSLDILSVIAFIDENFDKQFKAIDLKAIHSVPELITLIGEKLD